jgi:excinuclease ABC subunit A
LPEEKEKTIRIRGAKMHNLKNIDIDIPRRKLVVITGLSGSGKSSLAFDTLYAEGQRRYVESLSSYARQFLGRLDKPLVDQIDGIAPAVAIEQKVNTSNPRSTVGSTTEIYDYLKLLFARIGTTYSPISDEKVTKDSVENVIDLLKKLPEGTKCILLAPVQIKERSSDQILKLLTQQGYARIKVNGVIERIQGFDKEIDSHFDLVVDRIVIKHEESFYHRMADSVETAFFEGKGSLSLWFPDDSSERNFTNRFERDGIRFTEPNVHLFSFNNPLGACPKCEGYGDLIGIDQELVIPNTSLSVFEGAVAPWRSERASRYKKKLIENAYHFDFPIHKPYFELTQDQKDLLWNGNKYFKGIRYFFDKLEAKNYKIQNRVMLSRYRGRTKCDACNGLRLCKEANYVKISGHSISDLTALPINKLQSFFQKLILTSYEEQVAERLLIEINNRIQFMMDVGLSYLNLNRKSNSLSGGESQRINLATSLGSSLVGSLYILDEPSIGLHPHDSQRLIQILKKLRDLGNTVIVVEHDEDIIRAADHIIDIGPQAGVFGGELVAQGSLKEILKSGSLTADYLTNKRKINHTPNHTPSKKEIVVHGARVNNLKNIDVAFPLNRLTAVTGVSGSGKSSLIRQILWPALLREKDIYGEKIGEHNKISGSIDDIDHVEYINQNPIGISSRSNPITYIKAYDEIRKLFADQNSSKVKGFTAKHFSFNVDGGRCETCKGEGQVTIEMQFMADVKLKCETCQGKRFKKEVLEVRFGDKNIHDVLSLSVDEAISFFSQHNQEKIVKKIKPLQDVGMGYVALGQSSSTLSGGEAQRIKLASFLAKGSQREKILFLFDEPTTGLHTHDIEKLVGSFRALIANGHSIIVIEHNIALISCVDHIIDLGPVGGAAGGQLIAQGAPRKLAKDKNSSLFGYLPTQTVT